MDDNVAPPCADNLPAPDIGTVPPKCLPGTTCKYLIPLIQVNWHSGTPAADRLRMWRERAINYKLRRIPNKNSRMPRKSHDGSNNRKSRKRDFRSDVPENLGRAARRESLEFWQFAGKLEEKKRWRQTRGVKSISCEMVSGGKSSWSWELGVMGRVVCKVRLDTRKAASLVKEITSEHRTDYATGKVRDLRVHRNSI